MRTGIFALLAAAALVQAEPLPSGVRFLPGPVNGLLAGRSVLIYGDAGARLPGIRHVLFTHARRDVAWAGVEAVSRGAEAIVPAAERDLLENPGSFWQAYETGRYHDYSQVNTKVLREPLRVSRGVRDGEVLDLDGVRVEVISTPGYTRGAVSYLLEAGGTRIACTGDLIYGDGQLFDLSSLQDAIPEAKIRGYHGFAARAGDLIESLRKIAARKPGVLVPARGPVIQNPQRAIGNLITRLQALMASHFSTDALRWYWGEESLRIRSRKALDGQPVESMPMAPQRPLPPWILSIGNSRLILSSSGAGFLVDAGYSDLLAKLDELVSSGRMITLEGIWITHYHDDHTDYAQSLASRFQCPVHFTTRMAEILARPSGFRLPCLTTNPITSASPQPDGARMRWQEFQLTFFDFPGQTLYHGGLLVEKDGGGSIFFAGDSFTPSGIDDYCLQNRNFVHENEGYLYCLNVLERLPKDTWLVNQHVGPTFKFSPEHFLRMRTELDKRRQLLAEMAPWPDPDYEIDESWAAVHPYLATARDNSNISLQLRILNHSPRAETYRLHWNVPDGWGVVRAEGSVTVPPRAERAATVDLLARGPGLHVVTADVEFSGRQLREWAEALVRVEAAR